MRKFKKGEKIMELNKRSNKDRADYYQKKWDETFDELTKYKKMLDKLECNLERIVEIEFDIHYHPSNILKMIEGLKQKYFPEPVKKYITIEVESEKESEVDDGMEDIKKFVNSTSCPKMKISNYGYIEE